MKATTLCGVLAVGSLTLIAAACAPGTGTGKPAPATGTTVTAEDMQNRADEPIELLLQRKVPGLRVSRNQAGELMLTIRGGSSGVSATENTDAPPLYLVNGLPYAAGPGGTLTGIDPEDIESVKVYRGAEAVIYGIEGANGVIDIKLKSGARKK